MMTYADEDVLASAKAMFGENELAEALAVLGEYGARSHDREVNRVRLAVLQLSEGRMEKLRHWVAMAKADYRDPLAALELRPISPEEGAKLQAEAKSLIQRWGKK